MASFVFNRSREACAKIPAPVIDLGDKQALSYPSIEGIPFPISNTASFPNFIRPFRNCAVRMNCLIGTIAGTTALSLSAQMSFSLYLGKRSFFDVSIDQTDTEIRSRPVFQFPPSADLLWTPIQLEFLDDIIPFLASLHKFPTILPSPGNRQYLCSPGTIPFLAAILLTLLGLCCLLFSLLLHFK